ncbi:hypothetical protein VTI74DRAFT_5722 [Chaetomium olivicolor]
MGHRTLDLWICETSLSTVPNTMLNLGSTPETSVACSTVVLLKRASPSSCQGPALQGRSISDWPLCPSLRNAASPPGLFRPLTQFPCSSAWLYSIPRHRPPARKAYALAGHWPPCFIKPLHRTVSRPSKETVLVLFSFSSGSLCRELSSSDCFLFHRSTLLTQKPRWLGTHPGRSPEATATRR